MEHIPLGPLIESQMKLCSPLQLTLRKIDIFAKPYLMRDSHTVTFTARFAGILNETQIVLELAPTGEFTCVCFSSIRNSRLPIGHEGLLSQRFAYCAVVEPCTGTDFQPFINTILSHPHILRFHRRRLCSVIWAARVNWVVSIRLPLRRTPVSGRTYLLPSKCRHDLSVPR